MEQDLLDSFLRLAVALAAGLLIGAERGWHKRSQAEGTRVTGIRTLGLSGLLGGLCALISQQLDLILLGFAFVAFTLVVLVTRIRASSETQDLGATTIIAALVTFALGAVAVLGDIAIAAAGAVVTAMLLGVKTSLHRWLSLVTEEEMLAVLKLLAMSVVLLPVLPDKGYGPWQVLNPYELWLMVVLIAGVSSLGYGAIRIAGPRRGVLLASLAGGMVSSTVVTLNFAHLSRSQDSNPRLLAAGIGLAATTMFPRCLLVAGILAPGLLPFLVWPLGLATLGGLAAAAAVWPRQAMPANRPDMPLGNPFEFITALKFGLLLALVMLLATALRLWFGDAGIFVLAAISGLADVDAATLSLARLTGQDLPLGLAALGILIAATSNSLVKVIIAASVGVRSLGIHVFVILGLALGCGGLGMALALSLAQ
ncbi:MgtC/SapB family protein [Pelagibius litoralis]|uniref:MgtC/SapB family protein n=1 Tax=Pelagibius litoralis TaxID=374515 RepID=A0A967C4Z3_9PROT|nr:DUF4010 domain-containing protein [Pelagibius litoralis]NIA67451.1 MgtC/SapB family protein [Pelagibius litoralis]